MTAITEPFHRVYSEAMDLLIAIMDTKKDEMTDAERDAVRDLEIQVRDFYQRFHDGFREVMDAY